MKGSITFKDEFTINEISEGIDALRDAIKKFNEITIDAAEVKRIDVAVAQLLVSAQKECRSSGRKIIFKISDSVAGILSSVGIQLK